MELNRKFLYLIVEFYEKIQLLNKQYKSLSGEVLDSFGFNEMHCIDFIGRLENPNVTKLSECLKLTRGAVSKIIKKLLRKGAIEIYTQEKNKKEIYYKLTKTGESIFEAHEKMHKKWVEDDINYLSGVDKNELKTVCKFLENYNKFAESRIKILKGEDHENSTD